MTSVRVSWRRIPAGRLGGTGNHNAVTFLASDEQLTWVKLACERRDVHGQPFANAHVARSLRGYGNSECKGVALLGVDLKITSKTCGISANFQRLQNHREASLTRKFKIGHIEVG